MINVSDTARIAANYEVVTPMMSAGANFAAEFRLPEYVNLVRWWWRFLALGRFGGDEAVAAFWEAVLFGWSEKPFGQKLVRFRVVGKDDEVWPAPWESPTATPENFNEDVTASYFNGWSGIEYLSAQGFHPEKDPNNRRKAIQPGRNPAKISAFKIEARMRPIQYRPYFEYWKKKRSKFLDARKKSRHDEWKEAKSTLINAMALIGLAGGMGARSRRGFGSLAVRELRVDEEEPIITGLPADVAEYKAALKKHLGTPTNTAEPPYTAFSTETSVRICATGTCARTLMNDIGWAFQIYRSWGQRKNNDDRTLGHEHTLKPGFGKLPAGTAKVKSPTGGWYNDKFTADHNDFYNSNKGQPFPTSLNARDNRSVFGLPHNYGNVNVDTGWTAVGWEVDLGRRASPLLFHFHKLSDGKCVFLAMVVPAKLLPDGAEQRARRTKDGTRTFDNQRPFPVPDWSLLKGFHAFVSDPANLPAMGPTGGAGGGVEKTSYTRRECATSTDAGFVL